MSSCNAHYRAHYRNIFSSLIADIWLSLIDGSDIDELCEMMAKDQIIGVMDRSPTPEQDPEHEANDDDDPNGPVMTAPHAIPGPSRGPTVDFEDLSDEEGDW